MSTAPDHVSPSVYIDEEDCLGLDLFLLELELIIGNSHHGSKGKIDEVRTSHVRVVQIDLLKRWGGTESQHMQNRCVVCN